jgi:hypothetical protein
LQVAFVLAPNIYISQSFDSREAVIAKNFVRQAKEIYDKTGNRRPLFASLIICREALQDRKEFEDFINDITMLETRPDGFYLTIASRSAEALSDIYHTDVVANSRSFESNVKGYLKNQRQNVIVILRSYPELIPIFSWGEMREQALGDLARPCAS